MKTESRRYPAAIWPMLKSARAANRRAFQAKYNGINIESLGYEQRNAAVTEKRLCAYPFHIKDSWPNYHAPQMPWVGKQKRGESAE